jgi:hypothetical protein
MSAEAVSTEAVGERGDDVEAVGADRAGRTQDYHATAGCKSGGQGSFIPALRSVKPRNYRTVGGFYNNTDARGEEVGVSSEFDLPLAAWGLLHAIPMRARSER